MSPKHQIEEIRLPQTDATRGSDLSADNAIGAVEHIGFTVSDLDSSILFYTALLGNGPFYEATEGRPFLGDVVGYPLCRVRIAFFSLPNTPIFLELLEYLQPTGKLVEMETRNTGIAHLCFLVTDLDSEFQRITALGATLRSSGPVDRPDGGRATYFRDPDGITVEMQEAPK